MEHWPKLVLGKSDEQVCKTVFMIDEHAGVSPPVQTKVEFPFVLLTCKIPT